MTISSRIIKDFKRIDQDLIKEYEGIPAANIGDVLNRLYSMNSSIKPFNHNRLIGNAFTVKVPDGDNLFIHQAIDLAKEGDILVVNAEGATNRAVFGEMMLDVVERKKLGGLIIDGCVRDIDAIRESTVPVYAIGVTPQGPYKHGPGEINVPISCGGQPVRPGDLLVGDDDGVVVIPSELVHDVLDDAKKKYQGEIEELDLRNGSLSDEEILKKHQNKFIKELESIDIRYE